jgi:hypothetical protein
MIDLDFILALIRVYLRLIFFTFTFNSPPRFIVYFLCVLCVLCGGIFSFILPIPRRRRRRA